ncbi:WXG100 family type VII secretion target [Paenibacillus barcinonensis]|uniref:WXG100 family type VII secretion target n=1 Tax=Paenibacillus TaxID=44249 RepID=UPI001C12430A|nr:MULTISPECIES: WXG100 family type VII secretion target [Paenibacillus]MBU5354934.1 WXG100 family type VII secretion target [Paenibacillus barcinonensis]MDM5281742.1 WXG100 family type VII secretion target [Paenibacillus silvae]
MAKILITPDEITNAGQKFEQAAQESQQMAQQLNSLMESMRSQWEGMTSNKFYDRFLQDKKSMDVYVRMLQDVGQDLKDIATRFRQADQQ